MSREDGRVPRYVPTLTEVVAAPGGTPVSVTLPPPPPEPLHLADEPAMASTAMAPPMALDEEDLLRVLQRVEVLLDRRLSATLSHVAESVARDFAQRLRTEMEPLIREVVGEAVAEELNPANHPRA